MQAKDYFILITYYAVLTLLSLFVGFVLVLYTLYRKRQLLMKQQLHEFRNKAEKELLKAKLEVQEETIRHIGREVHDNFGQLISMAILHINRADNIQLATKNELMSAKWLLEKTIDGFHDLQKSLAHNVIRRDGFIAVLRNQIEQLIKTNHYIITFDVSGEYNMQDEHREVILLRIFQEALSNIIRHSGATEVNVLLDCTSSATVLKVQDNGKGFRLAEGIDNTGGIMNMYMRSEFIGADCLVLSQQGTGTTVEIVISN